MTGPNTQVDLPAEPKADEELRPADEPKAAELVAGSLLSGRYRLIKELGRGAMGVVFLAEHTLLNKTVAIKLLQSTNATWVERFKREAQVLAKVNHPNVCAVSDFGPTGDEGFFLVIEYLDGQDLFSMLDQEQRLEPVRALRLFGQLLSALSACHALGVVHRDLKPENVMVLRAPDGTETVKLLDFGIAGYQGEENKRASRLTAQGMAMGTPHYMSPEQATADTAIDGRSDLYQVGVMFFEALSGKLPFDAEQLAKVLWMHVHVPSPKLSAAAPDLPQVEELDGVLVRLLSKDREARYQTADEVIAALDAIASKLDEDGGDTSPAPAVAALAAAPEASATTATTATIGPTGTVATPVAGPTGSKTAKWPPRDVMLGVGALILIALIAIALQGPSDTSPAAEAGDATEAPTAGHTPEGAQDEGASGVIVPGVPSPGSSTSTSTSQSTARFQVTHHVIAQKVSGKKPRHVATTFPSTIRKLYCHVTFDNRARRRRVDMVWSYGDREVHRVKLKVGSSRAYRSWASMRIRAHQLGAWRCDIMSRDGKTLLSRKAFTIQGG